MNTHSALRTARAAVRLAHPDIGPPVDGSAPLEITLDRSDPPRVVAATVVEDGALRSRQVSGDPSPEFAAFLDGTQSSVPFAYMHGVPLVMGSVAAVVRERQDRRMVTWRNGPLINRRVYAPRGMLGETLWAQLDRAGLDPCDTSPEAEEAEHPHTVALRARDLVQADRELLERRLAEAWVAKRESPLFVDGGLRGSDTVAKSHQAVGVVKSHRTIYAMGAALPVIFGLRASWRTSVFRVDTGRRTPVFSWYLRLRDIAGHDPFFGLVRVEVAETSDPSARADAVSRWILAEVIPLAMPDTRWHNLVYPIRDCEEFLRAIA